MLLLLLAIQWCWPSLSFCSPPWFACPLSCPLLCVPGGHWCFDVWWCLCCCSTLLLVLMLLRHLPAACWCLCLGCLLLNFVCTDVRLMLYAIHLPCCCDFCTPCASLCLWYEYDPIDVHSIDAALIWLTVNSLLFLPTAACMLSCCHTCFLFSAAAAVALLMHLLVLPLCLHGVMISMCCGLLAALFWPLSASILWCPCMPLLFLPSCDVCVPSCCLCCCSFLRSSLILHCPFLWLNSPPLALSDCCMLYFLVPS